MHVTCLGLPGLCARSPRAATQCRATGRVLRTALPSPGWLSFCFLAIFSKDSLKYALAERFQKIDPYLGAMVVGAKVTWHGFMLWIWIFKILLEAKI
jgi:hypothetical protein